MKLLMLHEYNVFLFLAEPDVGFHLRLRKASLKRLVTISEFKKYAACMTLPSQASQWDLSRPFLSLSVKYLWFVCVLYKYSVILILDSSSCSKFPNFEIDFLKPSSSDASEIENFTQTKIEVHQTSWQRRSCI